MDTPKCPAMPFTGCGGDPVGSWKLAAQCDPAPPQCPMLTTDVTNYTWTATVKADGTFTYTTGGALTAIIPASCLGTAGLPATCDELRQSGTFESCTTTSDGGCRCSEKPTMVVTDGGTWSAAGNKVKLTNSSGSQTNPYCVNGNILQLGYLFDLIGEVLVFTRS